MDLEDWLNKVGRFLLQPNKCFCQFSDIHIGLLELRLFLIPKVKEVER